MLRIIPLPCSIQLRNEEAIVAVSALTAIFQDCLHAQYTNMTDTIEHEKEIVDCYWTIEKLDPANYGKLVWDISVDLMKSIISKNIIQPLVENALFHGLDDPGTGEKHGTIEISIKRADSNIIIIISNSGNPISEETLRRINSSKPSHGRHIGISNIRKRLELLYGDDACLRIFCDEKTRAEIRIPG